VIVVVACSWIETLFVRRRPGLRIVRTPMAAASAVALRRALAGDRPEMIVSTGFCGGLDPVLRPGALVLADRVLFRGETVAIDSDLLDAARGRLEARGLPVRVGSVVSSEAVAATPAEKARLAQAGALAVEMEAGVLATVASEEKSGFLSLRAVLDPAVEPLPFHALRPRVGEIVRRPVTSLRLAWRALLASRAVGKAVAALVGGVGSGVP